MTYAVRVRLYYGALQGPVVAAQADTDPELGEGDGPGCERAATLEDVGEVLRDLVQAFHGPDVQLLGLSDMAMGAYLTMMREHIGKAGALSYQQSYSLKGPIGPDWWYACVDVHIAL